MIWLNKTKIVIQLLFSFTVSGDQNKFRVRQLLDEAEIFAATNSKRRFEAGLQLVPHSLIKPIES